MLFACLGKSLVTPLVWALVLLGLAGVGHTRCTPAQMEEARLQFSNAQPLIDSQQWTEVIAQMNSVVGFCPEFFPAWRGLGRAYQQTAQLELAAKAYEKVIEVRAEEAEAFDFANLAQILTRQKKYREARAEYLKAKIRDPQNCAVLVNLSILHTASGYPMQAVETLEDALIFCPQNTSQIMPHLAEAANKAADQQRQIGNVERADYFARKAAEYGGSAGGATAYQQIQASMQRQDFAGAIELCQRLVAGEPDHANAWLTLARAADALGRKTQSAEAYEKYLELRPDNVDETASMIIVLAEAEQCESAVDAARSAIRRFTGLGSRALGKIHFAYGKALFCASDYAGARAQFQRAVQSGDDVWARAAREGVAACDQQLQHDAAQRQRAAQQGG